MLGKNPVMLIGHNKGKNLEQNIQRNFAQPNPEGYRKALRLMKLAEKYNLPIISFVDTQGHIREPARRNAARPKPLP